MPGIYYSPSMVDPSLRCIGHRGAMGHEPENTLRSIRTALLLGTPYVEVDVYQVDNQLIVFHDEHLERTTNGVGLLAEQSFTYLRSLDAGEGEIIPTLEEVCGLVQGRAGLNIELKGPGTAALAAHTVSMLVKAGWDKRAFLISSFRQLELLDIRQADSDLQLGVITRTMLPGDLNFADAIGAFSIHPAHHTLDINQVTAAHEGNHRIFAYTVNDPPAIARMAELGIDGVFTNFPERVLDNYAQKNRPGIW